MTIVEIFLILTGVLFIIISFFFSEKLSGKDLRNISELSEKEINVIMEKRLAEADSKIDDMVDASVDLSLNKINRELNAETDDKIMAIGNYAKTAMDDFKTARDTAMAELTKTYNEVTFLHSMLGDKREELDGKVAVIKQMIDELKVEEEKLAAYFEAAETLESKNDPINAEADQLRKQLDAVMADDGKTNDKNQNEEIIRLYKSGMSPVDIAKELSVGFGEVSLVIDLYNKE